MCFAFPRIFFHRNYERPHFYIIPALFLDLQKDLMGSAPIGGACLRLVSNPLRLFRPCPAEGAPRAIPRPPITPTTTAGALVPSDPSRHPVCHRFSITPCIDEFPILTSPLPPPLPRPSAPRPNPPAHRPIGRRGVRPRSPVPSPPSQASYPKQELLRPTPMVTCNG